MKRWRAPPPLPAKAASPQRNVGHGASRSLTARSVGWISCLIDLCDACVSRLGPSQRVWVRVPKRIPEDSAGEDILP
ncbi:hypothetical protein BU26DRAFT_234390 [Trematosphaeria pertusa]|uniref:Uncharacterized protein n=1 Tax=Trematosphaeria pertusa TaxID=390896 RepID=A0A6A6IVD1_9PLEO|nr:uncharacterized protein BU26DRAFT_234390 [Trematosphaeria pertusa]KAF2254037.1 hypothetical protein BU26DRAFT_234390 [Trematosphaeria pertusa]